MSEKGQEGMGVYEKTRIYKKLYKFTVVLRGLPSPEIDFRFSQRPTKDVLQVLVVLIAVRLGKAFATSDNPRLSEIIL